MWKIRLSFHLKPIQLPRNSKAPEQGVIPIFISPVSPHSQPTAHKQVAIFAHKVYSNKGSGRKIELGKRIQTPERSVIFTVNGHGSAQCYLWWLLRRDLTGSGTCTSQEDSMPSKGNRKNKTLEVCKCPRFLRNCIIFSKVRAIQSK